MGQKMKDIFRFSVAFWHTFRHTGQDQFGSCTIKREWDDGSDSLENALRRVDAAFELFQKLGVQYYCFHDVDVAPEGKTLQETEEILTKVTDHMLALQQKTGVRCLWATQNLFSHPRFMNGAATNPDFNVFCWAAAKTKMALDAGKKLGAANHVFWGGREGYQTLLNTKVKAELDHLAALLKMAVDYKKKIGATFQLLIEPKPKEPTKHQYDYDAQTVMGFLKQYHLEDDFKLNIEPNHTMLAGHDYEHDLLMSQIYGKLGSIDSNTGDAMLGWDTDQFPMDVKKCILTMMIVLKQGGIAPGGFNFDCKVRRESTDPEDLFIAHVGAMDTFARGLRCAAKILEEGEYQKLIDLRYSSWEKSDLAKKASLG